MGKKFHGYSFKSKYSNIKILLQSIDYIIVLWTAMDDFYNSISEPELNSGSNCIWTAFGLYKQADFYVRQSPLWHCLRKPCICFINYMWLYCINAFARYTYEYTSHILKSAPYFYGADFNIWVRLDAIGRNQSVVTLEVSERPPISLYWLS